MSLLRRNLAVLTSALVGLCILCGLGFWQVRRLAWKEGLIAELAGRMAQPPQALAEGLPEYSKVQMTGALDTSHPLYRVGVYHDGPGFEVIAPFALDDGRAVLVDLGAVPNRDAALNPVAEINGIIRLHNLGKGFFDPPNNAASNSWYWWDIPAMQQAAGMPPSAPAIVQALDNSSGAEAAAPVIELRNSHLGYAITWFGLAAALAGVTAAFVFQRERRYGQAP